MKIKLLTFYSFIAIDLDQSKITDFPDFYTKNSIYVLNLPLVHW